MFEAPYHLYTLYTVYCQLSIPLRRANGRNDARRSEEYFEESSQILVSRGVTDSSVDLSEPSTAPPQATSTNEPNTANLPFSFGAAGITFWWLMFHGKWAEKEPRMTITVDIRPEVQAELGRQAAAQGRAIEAYVESLIEEAVDLPSEANPPVFNKEPAQAAGARIRELRKGLTLGGQTIRELIDEGRR